MRYAPEYPKYDKYYTMKYSIRKLDNRFSYSEHFAYCIMFDRNMDVNQGPLNFELALDWFRKTYGSSATIVNWAQIHNYYDRRIQFVANHDPMPAIVNQMWSWSLDYNELRIYVKTDKELSFFKLAYPSSNSKKHPMQPKL